MNIRNQKQVIVADCDNVIVDKCTHVIVRDSTNVLAQSNKDLMAVGNEGECHQNRWTKMTGCIIGVVEPQMIIRSREWEIV